MADFVRLTNARGASIHVNLDLVEHIQPAGKGATITFLNVSWVGADIVTVRETPDDILRQAAVAV